MKNKIFILSLMLVLLGSCKNGAEQRICFFGSSVCRGVGADSLHGYAYLYSEQLPRGWSSVNLSVDGNDTYDLLARFDRDLLHDESRFVFIGLSLGNEGLHESGEAAVLSYQENLMTLVRKIREAGRIPVVAMSYPRADFNPVDYEDLLSVNLNMMQWEVPTVAFLGALDDGHGRWADECWDHEDKWHPNSYGHRLLCSAIPPTLFQALAEGKPVPERQKPGGESRVGEVSFVPEEGLTSYTLSYMSGDTVFSTVFSAARHTLWHYIGTECVDTVLTDEIPRKFSIRGSNLRELFFFRTPLSPREIGALAEGKMLRSSLEIYAPLTGENKSKNLAQTLNIIEVL